MVVTLDSLQQLLDARFGGILTFGKHSPDGQCCALELLSQARKLSWTDNPSTVRCWDLRELNDMLIADAVRTRCLLPVVAAYDGSMDWPPARQYAVASALALGTVRTLVSGLPALAPEWVLRCAEVQTLAEAQVVLDEMQAVDRSLVFIQVPRPLGNGSRYNADWMLSRAQDTLHTLLADSSSLLLVLAAVDALATAAHCYWVVKAATVSGGLAKEDRQKLSESLLAQSYETICQVWLDAAASKLGEDAAPAS